MYKNQNGFMTILGNNLKKQYKEIDSSQQIKVISFLILIRYIEINNNISHKFIKNPQEYSSYCESLLNENIGFFKKIKFYDFFPDIYHIIDNIGCSILSTLANRLSLELINKNDFSKISNEYRSFIETIVSESPYIGYTFTPTAIAKAVAVIASPNNGDIIYDPSCGTAGFLLETIKYGKIIHPNSNYKLFGSDISSLSCVISLISLILNGNEDFDLNLCDTIKSKQEEKKFDLIISNPPFGKINLEGNHISNKIQNLDYIFLKKIMYDLKDNGKAVVVLPERFLFDSNQYFVELKKELFENFKIESIISVPSGAMLPATAVKVIILSFSKQKPTENFWFYRLNTSEKFSRKNPIQFGDFADLLEKIKQKTISDNSWFVSINELNEKYIIPVGDTDNYFSSKLKSPNEYLERIYNHQGMLLSKLDSISDKIKEINNTLEILIKDSKFSDFKINELAKSKVTKKLSREHLNNNGLYRVYGGNGLIGYHTEYIHEGSFIVIGRVGAYCGNVRYIEGKIWVTDNAIVLECINSAKIYPSYLAKILQKKSLRSLAQGTAQPHLNVSKINDVTISLPPLEVQIQIDNCLNWLDKEIIAQQEIINELSSCNNKLIDSFYEKLLRL